MSRKTYKLGSKYAFGATIQDDLTRDWRKWIWDSGKNMTKLD